MIPPLLRRRRAPRRIALALVLLTTPALVRAADPPRLRRSESFLGIHFDFHAGPDCKEVGKNTTPAMVNRIIDLVKPDYLQIDCKGHPGYTSYPTKVGNPVPGFVGDPLRVWRQATARRGVALYTHYSGVYDQHAVEAHPDWAATHADGSKDANATTPFGPYANSLLIPQLRELAGAYGVDGVWIDGDCWSAVPDYGDAAARAFRAATGFTSLPKGPGDPAWRPFLDFHRDAYRDYLRRVVAGVKATNPGFQICSNWAFTDHMPEPVSAPVDFLSGDFSPQDSVNSARLSGRYLARQGIPWDLMAWSFTTIPSKTTTPGRNTKSAVQLQREAAVILALGGGFQAYFVQRRDGSVDLDRMPVMAEVAAFCRARQSLCHHAQAVPQIALLFSTPAHYHGVNQLFSRDNERLGGILAALLESRHSVEVLGEHHLAGRLDDYPLIVVPEWEYLAPSFIADLKGYVKRGGNLLLVGAESAALFADALDVKPDSATPWGIHLEHEGSITALPGTAPGFILGHRAKPFGTLHPTDTDRAASRPAGAIASSGKGKIAATFFPMGRAYNHEPNGKARAYLDALTRSLFTDPIAVVTGSPASEVDVHVATKQGRLLVNLVNASGPHRTEPVFDAIPPVGPLDVVLRVPARPARVTLEPSGVELPYRHESGHIRLSVPGVAVHEVIVVEPAK
ncbi:alpha-amylase family protein [Aquisphaera insulae]|uniref:alpha-amylase family protein n=1 Tax=Aquisphaera insulae TaxID=2712864 RepID=UPI0013E9C4E7|nr:alpha-amylase family protein [Aquisphaera insulae]